MCHPERSEGSLVSNVILNEVKDLWADNKVVILNEVKDLWDDNKVVILNEVKDLW